MLSTKTSWVVTSSTVHFHSRALERLEMEKLDWDKSLLAVTHVLPPAVALKETCYYVIFLSPSPTQTSSEVAGGNFLFATQTTKFSHTFPESIIRRYLTSNPEIPMHASSPDIHNTILKCQERIHSSRSDCIHLQIIFLEYIPITQRKQIQ